MGSVRFWRRTAQTASFALLLWGGYLTGLRSHASVPRPAAPPSAPACPAPAVSGAPASQAMSIYWVPKTPSVVDVYAPSAVCKFNPQGGLLAACPVYFLSDKLTWLIPLRYLLGYALAFAALGLLLSRLWCGWVCPLGAVEDAINWSRRRLGFDHVDFTASFRRTLEWGKYGLLGLAVLISGLIAIPALKDYQCYFFLPFCQLCPGRILFPLAGGTLPKVNDFSSVTPAVFTVLAWAFLGLFLAGAFIGRRVWCRLCPIGACHEFFNRGGLFALVKDPVKCNRCGVCAYACPVEHQAVYEEKERRDVSHRDCILCLRCVELCPKEDCLKLTFAGRKVVGSSFKPEAG